MEFDVRNAHGEIDFNNLAMVLEVVYVEDVRAGGHAENQEVSLVDVVFEVGNTVRILKNQNRLHVDAVHY